MKRKIISVLVLIVMLSCFFCFYPTKAANLEEQKEEAQNKKEEAQEKLEFVQEELSEAIIRIQELGENIEEAEKEIDTMETELEGLQVQVDDITIKLEEAQMKYDENHNMMEERLIVMYEYGETSYLDILLSSSNIVEFISNYYLIEQLMQSDTDLIYAIEKERDEIEIAKTKLEEQKAKLKTLKAKKEQKYIMLQNSKTVQQKEIDGLSETEKQLQNQIEEYKAEEQRIENLINSAANNYVYDGQYTGGLMAWPVAKSGTYITSDYGIREHPIQGVIKGHTGIDIGNAGFGAPVIAATDGIVSLAGYNGGYGNCVMINHGNGVSTLYGHGQKILTKVGTQVKKGDVIMEVGSTGVSTGPHLHFEVRINGRPVDPKQYVQ